MKEKMLRKRWKKATGIESTEVGYIYNERTGEFKTTSQEARSLLLCPFKWILAPFCALISLLRLLLGPFWFLKRFLLRLLGLMIILGSISWRVVKIIARRVLFPAIKWWEVTKDAIGDRDWFFIVVWSIPGYILYMIYRQIAVALLGVLYAMVLFVLNILFLLIEWFKGVIQ